MKSIETLARVSCFVDKTGTITENSMSVKDMIPTKEYDAEKMPELNGLLSDFVGAMSSDNSTMEALKDYFKKKTEQSASKVVPFTSVTKIQWSHVRGEVLCNRSSGVRAPRGL